MLCQDRTGKYRVNKRDRLEYGLKGKKRGNNFQNMVINMVIKLVRSGDHGSTITT